MRVVSTFLSVLAASSISGAVQAQTAWPDFMPTLQPGSSVSPVAAVLPADVVIEPPATDVPADKALWAGQWHGWAGKGKVIDERLAVAKVTAVGATIFYAAAGADLPPYSTKAEATFVAGELQATIGRGAKIAFRMRESGAIEFLWKYHNEWSAGVLSKDK